jgi:hypothetical protein
MVETQSLSTMETVRSFITVARRSFTTVGMGPLFTAAADLCIQDTVMSESYTAVADSTAAAADSMAAVVDSMAEAEDSTEEAAGTWEAWAAVAADEVTDSS